MRRLRFTALSAVMCLGILLGAGVAHAGNPATITVTVTIQSVSVSTAGAIAFGTVNSSTSTVSGASSTVTNNGNVTETYSLSLTNPASWTADQAAPALAEHYALLAEFNSIAPLSSAFSYANHALSTSSVISSATKFAGDQTGLSVTAAGVRHLWFRFDAPTSTAVTAQQSITVTVTASAG